MNGMRTLKGWPFEPLNIIQGEPGDGIGDGIPA